MKKLLRKAQALGESLPADLPDQEPFFSLLDPAKTLQLQACETRKLLKKNGESSLAN